MEKIKLDGLIAAVCTQLDDGGAFNPENMKCEIDYVLKSGFDAVFPLGFAGEVKAFDRCERKEIIKNTVDIVSGRAKVIAGTFAESTRAAGQYIQDAKEAGADIALLTPPSFYPLTQEEMIDFFIKIADDEILPVIIYNCPESLNHMSPASVSKVSVHPGIIGLKETSDQITLQKMQILFRDREDFTLISGDEFLYLPALSIGIESFIMGGPSTLTPGWCVEILNLFNDGRYNEANKEYLRFIDFYHSLFEATSCCAMAAIKAAMEIRGMGERFMAHPVKSLDRSEMKRVEKLLESFSLV